jgi:hypothetical protein
MENLIPDFRATKTEFVLYQDLQVIHMHSKVWEARIKVAQQMNYLFLYVPLIHLQDKEAYIQISF